MQNSGLDDFHFFSFLKEWKAAGGNVSRLSNLLSVSRVTLYRYIKKYGLEK